MPFASKTNTQMLSNRSKPTFLYAFRGSKGCLQEGTDRKKNERRKRERDRVCCLYRNRLGRAKARLRAAEFDDVGRGGERTATQTNTIPPDSRQLPVAAGHRSHEANGNPGRCSTRMVVL